MFRNAKSRKEQEVWEVCNALAKEHAKITYQAVGDRLLKLGYRRGSNSDICRYLSTWRKHCNTSYRGEQINAVATSTPISTSASIEYQKSLIQLFYHQQSQFDKLFNALQISKKINAILQKQLHALNEEHKQLKKNTISSVL